MPHTTPLQCLFLLINCAGIGIGTGPGVIQDHYSPTLGRHRSNPIFNGHIGINSSSHQPQFDTGSKPFIKPMQVIAAVGCPLAFIPLILDRTNIEHLSPQGQSSPVFSHKQNGSVQMQSKDMGPRFSKKGKLNVDEVLGLFLRWWEDCCHVLPLHLILSKHLTVAWPGCMLPVIVLTLVFTPVDQPEASAVIHPKQKSAKAAATDDDDATKCPRFLNGTGKYLHVG